MGVLTPWSRKTSTRLTLRSARCAPDLDSFRRLDRLGLTVTGQQSVMTARGWLAGWWMPDGGIPGRAKTTSSGAVPVLVLLVRFPAGS